MLSVICWLWTPDKDYRSRFVPEHVNILRRMVERHYPHPHTFSCITDQTEGFDKEVRVIPLWEDLAGMEGFYGPGTPVCYRRLKAFAPEMRELLGKRVVSLDLDTVIMGDLTPLWHRDEDFVMYQGTAPRTPYNGSMWLMTTGSRAQVWERFIQKPEYYAERSILAGHYGSDQAWISYCLGPNEAVWTVDDGVYSFRNHIYQRCARPPRTAKIVFFQGRSNPWDVEVVRRHPWVTHHYR